MNTNSVHFCFNDYRHLDVSPALAGLREDIQLKRDTRLKTNATIMLGVKDAILDIFICGSCNIVAT